MSWRSCSELVVGWGGGSGGSGDTLPFFGVLGDGSSKVSVRKSALIANYDRHPAAWDDIAARLPVMETRRCDTAAAESA